MLGDLCIEDGRTSPSVKFGNEDKTCSSTTLFPSVSGYLVTFLHSFLQPKEICQAFPSKDIGTVSKPHLHTPLPLNWGGKGFCRSD